MDDYADSLFKVREIVFQELHPDPDQAGSAAALLLDIEGVHRVAPVEPGTLQVAYHLLAITLEEIEQLLEKSGFHLDNGLVYKIRRALHHYTEEDPARQPRLRQRRGELHPEGVREPLPQTRTRLSG